MTRDELITKYILPAVHHHWNEKIYDEIEQMLKQEPCDDAISRRAVLEMAYDMSAIDGEHFTERYLVVDAEDIQKLSSVTPQPKIGHWKFVQRGKYIDICCSECGFQRVKEYAYNYTVDQISEQDIKDFFSNSNMNFCENCGAKMESEDKE